MPLEYRTRVPEELFVFFLFQSSVSLRLQPQPSTCITRSSQISRRPRGLNSTASGIVSVDSPTTDADTQSAYVARILTL